jgi:DNA-binding XRE family transcriptional regulator
MSGDPADDARMDRPPIAYAIDQYRMDCGLTIDELAEAVELDRSVVASHTTGAKTPRLKALKAYAKVFSEKLERAVPVTDLRRGIYRKATERQLSGY